VVADLSAITGLDRDERSSLLVRLHRSASQFDRSPPGGGNPDVLEVDAGFRIDAEHVRLNPPRRNERSSLISRTETFTERPDITLGNS
jgi:hypothetical protein